MTREEVIELLKDKRMEINYKVNGTTQFSEALDIAIQALEQEPCEDCIRREDAIGIVARIKEMHIDDREQYPINYGTICDIDLALQQLPSVTPSYNSIKTELKPCEDCVSREALRQKLEENQDFFVNAYDSFRDMPLNDKARCDEINNCIAMVVNAPSVTPQQKMGRWVEENINEWSRKVFCSECGCLPPFEHISNGDVYSASGYGVINKTKFCPNCGAYMRESEK